MCLEAKRYSKQTTNYFLHLLHYHVLYKTRCFYGMFFLGNSPASLFYMPTFRNTLFHLHKQVGTKCDWRREKLEYLYRKRFDWKIAEPIRRRVTGWGRFRGKNNFFQPLNRPYLSPPFLLASAISESNLFLYKYPDCSLLQSHFILPTYEDGTDRVFRNVGIYNSDAGELPKRKHTIFRTRRKFEIIYQY